MSFVVSSGSLAPALALTTSGIWFQVCGLEGSVVVSTNVGGGAGGAGAVSWPFVPYPQLHWQVRKQQQPGFCLPPPSCLSLFFLFLFFQMIGGALCLPKLLGVFLSFFWFFRFRFVLFLGPRRRGAAADYIYKILQLVVTILRN